jgi:hypothetical protein
MSWRQWFGLDKQPAKLEERTPQTLQIGDVVSYKDEDYFVEQRIEYHGDGGDVWWDFLLVNPKDTYWLGVVEDEGLVLTLYHDIPFHPDMPPATRLDYEGDQYSRKEYGFADAVMKKKSKLTVSGRVEYWDYESENGTQLSIERWGLNEVRTDQSEMTGTVHCSMGNVIKPYQITLLPGKPEDQ